MKTNSELCALFSRAGDGKMQDFPRLINLCYWLMRCEDTPGDIVEFGSNKGHTAVLLAALTKKRVYCFDSFKGLPAKSSFDITEAKFTEGSMKTERKVLEQTFVDAGIELPVIIEKWFGDVDPAKDMPKEIAFAVLDGDFFHSIMTSLRLVYPRLSPDAMCFIDDAPYTGLPGVKTALDQFLSDKPERRTFKQFRGPCGEVVQHACFRKL